MWNLNRIDTGELIYKTTDSDLENKFMVTGGWAGEG